MVGTVCAVADPAELAQHLVDVEIAGSFAVVAAGIAADEVVEPAGDAEAAVANSDPAGAVAVAGVLVDRSF